MCVCVWLILSLTCMISQALSVLLRISVVVHPCRQKLRLMARVCLFGLLATSFRICITTFNLYQHALHAN